MMNVWKSNMSWRYRERLRREAEEQAAGHHPPLSKDAWVQRRQEIQAFLTQKLHLQTDPCEFSRTSYDCTRGVPHRYGFLCFGIA